MSKLFYCLFISLGFSYLPRVTSPLYKTSTIDPNKYSSVAPAGKVVEGVNLFNGLPVQSIPLTSISNKGRVQYSFALGYSGVTEAMATKSNKVAHSGLIGLGWGFSTPSISINHNGTRRHFDDLIYANFGPYGGGQIAQKANGDYYVVTNPAIQISVIKDSDTNSDTYGHVKQWTVVFPDGKRMILGGDESHNRYIQTTGEFTSLPLVGIANAKKLTYKWDIKSLSEVDGSNAIHFDFSQQKENIAEGKDYVRNSLLTSVYWRDPTGAKVQDIQFQYKTTEDLAEYLHPDITADRVIAYRAKQPILIKKHLDYIKTFNNSVLQNTVSLRHKLVNKINGSVLTQKRLLSGVAVTSLLHGDSQRKASSVFSFSYHDFDKNYLLETVIAPNKMKRNVEYTELSIDREKQSDAVDINYAGADGYRNSRVSGGCRPEYCFLTARQWFTHDLRHTGADNTVGNSLDMRIFKNDGYRMDELSAKVNSNTVELEFSDLSSEKPVFSHFGSNRIGIGTETDSYYGNHLIQEDKIVAPNVYMIGGDLERRGHRHSASEGFRITSRLTDNRSQTKVNVYSSIFSSDGSEERITLDASCGFSNIHGVSGEFYGKVIREAGSNSCLKFNEKEALPVAMGNGLFAIALPTKRMVLTYMLNPDFPHKSDIKFVEITKNFPADSKDSWNEHFDYGIIDDVKIVGSLMVVSFKDNSYQRVFEFNGVGWVGSYLFTGDKLSISDDVIIEYNLESARYLLAHRKKRVSDDRLAFVELLHLTHSSSGDYSQNPENYLPHGGGVIPKVYNNNGLISLAFHNKRGFGAQDKYYVDDVSKMNYYTSVFRYKEFLPDNGFELIWNSKKNDDNNIDQLTPVNGEGFIARSIFKNNGLILQPVNPDTDFIEEVVWGIKIKIPKNEEIAQRIENNKHVVENGNRCGKDGYWDNSITNPKYIQKEFLGNKVDPQNCSMKLSFIPFDADVDIQSFNINEAKEIKNSYPYSTASNPSHGERMFPDPDKFFIFSGSNLLAVGTHDRKLHETQSDGRVYYYWQSFFNGESGFPKYYVVDQIVNHSGINFETVEGSEKSVVSFKYDLGRSRLNTNTVQAEFETVSVTQSNGANSETLNKLEYNFEFGGVKETYGSLEESKVYDRSGKLSSHIEIEQSVYVKTSTNTKDDLSDWGMFSYVVAPKEVRTTAYSSNGGISTIVDIHSSPNFFTRQPYLSYKHLGPKTSDNYILENCDRYCEKSDEVYDGGSFLTQIISQEEDYSGYSFVSPKENFSKSLLVAKDEFSFLKNVEYKPSKTLNPAKASLQAFYNLSASRSDFYSATEVGVPYLPKQVWKWQDWGASSSETEMAKGKSSAFFTGNGWKLLGTNTKYNDFYQLEESVRYLKEDKSVKNYNSTVYGTPFSLPIATFGNTPRNLVSVLMGEYPGLVQWSKELPSNASSPIMNDWSFKEGVTWQSDIVFDGRGALKVVDDWGPTNNLDLHNLHVVGGGIIVSAWIYAEQEAPSLTVERRLGNKNEGLGVYLDQFSTSAPVGGTFVPNTWQRYELKISKTDLNGLQNLFAVQNSGFIRTWIGFGASVGNSSRVAYVDNVVIYPEESSFALTNYDEHGRVLTQTDSYHQRIENIRDANGAVIAVRDNQGRIFEQNAVHRIGENGRLSE